MLEVDTKKQYPHVRPYDSPFTSGMFFCFHLKIFFLLFIFVLGLCCCAGFSLVAESGGSSPVVMLGLLIAVDFLVEEHRL